MLQYVLVQVQILRLVELIHTIGYLLGLIPNSGASVTSSPASSLVYVAGTSILGCINTITVSA